MKCGKIVVKPVFQQRNQIHKKVSSNTVFLKFSNDTGCVLWLTLQDGQTL
jgi:hypothetical protein